MNIMKNSNKDNQKNALSNEILKNNNQKSKGIFCILLAAFCFASMNLFVKLSGDLPVMQKCFFRNLVAAVVAFIIILKSKEKFVVGKGNWSYLMLRAAAGSVGIVCNFYAISKMNIADASMLNKLSPFFAILFSIVVLNEKPVKKEWIAVIIAFAGALFIIKPSFGMESVPAMLGFLGGMGAGLAYTCVRKLGLNGAKGSVIVLFFSVFSCMICVPFILIMYETMSWVQLVYLLLAGVAAAGGQFAITAAYTFAPAKEISVYDYTQVIFAAILSVIFVGDLPDVYSFIGYAVIIGVAVWKWKK